MHADDDQMRPPLDHAVRLYAAWKKAGRGGHGFGMRKTGLPSDTWIDRFRDWLSVQGLLKRPR